MDSGIEIRQVAEDDAALLVELCRQIEQESEFLLVEPGERNCSIEQGERQIKSILAVDNSVIFVAQDDNKLVGCLKAAGGAFKRNRHSAYITIGVLEEYTGRGIGTKLLERLEEWAHRNNIHRLHLTVPVPNGRAILLYKKVGFEIEGTKKASLLIKGKFIDEYCMSKLLKSKL